MCYNGKCCHCIEVETGSLIFAILNVMFTSLGLMSSIGGMIYVNVMFQEVIDSVSWQGDERKIQEVALFGIGANAVLSVLIVSFSISFAFAVVLTVGICKRNHHYLKAFFVYGVVKVVLGLIGAIVVTMIMPILMILYIVMGTFYGLILLMVRMTYLKFEKEITYKTFSNPITVVAKY